MDRKNNKKSKIQKSKSRVSKNIINTKKFKLNRLIALIIVIVLIVVILTSEKEINLLISTLCDSVVESTDVESSKVNWVSSKVVGENGNLVDELDSDGKVIKFPVPKGYTVSQIPGETSVNKGVVIYEGEIEWNTIFVKEEDIGTVNNENTYKLDTVLDIKNDSNLENDSNIENANVNKTNNGIETDNLNSSNVKNKIEESNEAESSNKKTSDSSLESDSTDSSRNKPEESSQSSEEKKNQNLSDTQGNLNSDKVINNEIQGNTVKAKSSLINNEPAKQEQNVNKNESISNNNTSKNINKNTNTNISSNADNNINNSISNNTSNDANNSINNNEIYNNTIKDNKVSNASEELNNNQTNSIEVENILSSKAKTGVEENSENIYESETITPLVEGESEEETEGNEVVESEAEKQTKINIFNLQKSRNQYVWVPIYDINEIYGTDNNGKRWGKLWNFPTSATGSRTIYNNSWSEIDGIMTITSKTTYREPDVMANMTSYDIDRYLPRYLYGQTRDELLSQEMEQNFYDMIESIKKYGGFYIGRYETGGLTSGNEAVVRKMDINIANVTWYQMYKKCQSLQHSNDNVKTSMIWGCLWDATLEWLVDSKATNSEGTEITYPLIRSNSTTWGNYVNSEFEYIVYEATDPTGTALKPQNKYSINDSDNKNYIPSGSSDYTKVNNIYDLAGNVWDWTLEAYSAGYRVCRGGSYNYGGNSYPASYRYSYSGPTFNSGDCLKK